MFLTTVLQLAFVEILDTLLMPVFNRVFYFLKLDRKSVV